MPVTNNPNLPHDPTLRPTLDVSTLAGMDNTGVKGVAALIEAEIHKLIGSAVTGTCENRTRRYGVSTVYFPAGTYRFERGIRIPANIPVALIGVGAGLTTIQLDAGAPTDAWPFDPMLPNAAAGKSPSLPPPLLPPTFKNSPSDMPTPTFAPGPGGVLDTAQWLVPGTSLRWTQLWNLYFAYVESHYAVYFTGLNTKSVLNSATIGITDDALTDMGWGDWVARGLTHAGDGDTPWMVQDIDFVGGGVLVAGNGAGTYGGGGQRWGAMRHCTFTDTAAWGLATEDQRVVNVEVTHCAFQRCAGGIGVRYAQSDLWVVSHCDFVDTKGIDLLVATANLTVNDCSFRGRSSLSAFADCPFVQIRTRPGPAEVPGAAFLSTVDATPPATHRAKFWYDATSAGRAVRFTDCNFAEDGRAPRDMVLIGPWTPGQSDSVEYPALTPASVTSSAAALLVSLPDLAPNADDVLFEDCHFGASSVPAGATVPRSAIRLATSVRGLNVLRAIAGRMSYVVYEEAQELLWGHSLAVAATSVDFAPARKASALSLRRTNWDNRIDVVPLPADDPTNLPSVFSFGGRGFEVSSHSASAWAGRVGMEGVGNLLAGVTPEGALSEKPVATLDGWSVQPSNAVPPSATLNENAPRVLVFVDEKRLLDIATPDPIKHAGVGGLPPMFLEFEVRSDDPEMHFAVSVNFGYFVLAGTEARRTPVTRVWQPIQLLVPPLPARWALTFPAPDIFDTNAPDPDWASAINVANLNGINLFSGLASKLKPFLSRFAVVLYIRSPTATFPLEVRRLRLMVGDSPGPHRNTQEVMDPTAQQQSLAGWRTRPLGRQDVVSDSLSDATALTRADVVEASEPKSGEFSAKARTAGQSGPASSIGKVG